MPKTGQAWARNGTLAATIFIRPNTDLAIEMLVEALKGGAQLPESKITAGVGAGTGRVGDRRTKAG